MKTKIHYFRRYRDLGYDEEISREEALDKLGRTFIKPWATLKDTSRERPLKTAFAMYWIERITTKEQSQ